MSDHIQLTIGDIKKQIGELETELAHKKRMVNDLYEIAGLPKFYTITDDSQQPDISAIRRDQWYGQPLSTAIREYLEMRRAANLGPATVIEIFDALTTGGFKFETKDDENAKRGLRISLTKNTAIFHRLPDKKHYGLLEWYPEAKTKKSKAGDKPDSADDGDDDLEEKDEKEFDGF